MTTRIEPTKTSGTKRWAHVTPDSDKELHRMAERLRVPVHGKGNQELHLDIPENKIPVAVKYGAVLVGISSICCVISNMLTA